MIKSAIEVQRIDSFEEWLQFACGATYDLDTMLSNLSADEVKEEVKLYAIAVAKEALKNASKVSESLKLHGDLVKKIILHESNIPNIE